MTAPNYCVTVSRAVTDQGSLSRDEMGQTRPKRSAKLGRKAQDATDGKIRDTTVADRDDQELLRACHAKPELFSHFYRRHNRAVLGYMMKRVGCAQTAADLTSETFMAAYKDRRKFDPDRGNALPWLYGIARNKLSRYHRNNARRRRWHRTLDTPELTDPQIRRVEELADLDAMAPIISAALDQLPVNQADAVRMRILEDRSYADAAQKLGTTEGNVRVRVSRGLTRLAELMEDPQ